MELLQTIFKTDIVRKIWCYTKNPYQRVQRSLIFWASLNFHSFEKKLVRSIFYSHFQKLSALLIITLFSIIVFFSNLQWFYEF